MKVFSRLRIVCFALLLLVEGGCLRVGLPEQFSSSILTHPSLTAQSSPQLPRYSRFQTQIIESTTNKARALLVYEPRTSSSAEDRQITLGHQYLLGIFPFTSLYFQHGAENFLIELAADSLIESGYEVFLCPKYLLPECVANLAGQLVLEPKYVDLRLNGFDGVFFRMLDVSGDLSIQSFAPLPSGEMAPNFLVHLPLHETSYRKYAHPPMLVNVLNKTTRAAFEKGIAQLPKRRVRRMLESSSREAFPPLVGTAQDSSMLSQLRSHVVEILRPEFETIPQPLLGRKIADSYGYESVPSFSPQAIARLVQRGISEGYERRGLNFFSRISAGPSKEARTFQDGTWQLRTVITKITMEEADVRPLQLHLRFELSVDEQVFRTVECQTQEALAEYVDGSLAVTLERAARSVLESFIRGACEKH